ncbi:uncharacterized protein DDB_G0284459-like [Pecten maximus]|uniref:uncharacterized protein DDB_G0284459-like n=1 Tax=Pecten maximus TaxID=6579 RepID=UPI001458D12F|nr:uncharacterized protein DDB_G0284459-like [Pecten maximus]
MPSSKKRRQSVSVVVDPNVCAFCNVAEDNEEVFGKMIKKCGLTVHYFCMLFSSGLSQGGKSEDEGIFGFMPEDIMKEVRRGVRLRCTYCKQKGATIGCVVGACRRVFHFGCGKTSGTLHQYYDSFRSFCEDHRPRQMVSVSDRLAFYGTANTTCAICMTSVETRASNETLRAPCCRNSWFHRSCISKHAQTAGLYFFKCPLCNNKEIFQEEMLKFGIYLPDQDAAWETEPDAFRDLLERYLHCDARHCHCPKGRDYNQDGQKWEIIVCNWCGSQGSHVGCHSLSKVGSEDVCQDCKAVDMKRSKGKQKTTTKEKSTVSSKPVKVDLDSKCKSEYPGKSDQLVKKKLPTKTSTLSSPPPSSTLSPGTVLRLSYEETDDELIVVDSTDSQPSTSKGYHAGEPSQSQQKKRKKYMKNSPSKRQKVSGEEDCSMSASKTIPTATITNPESSQASPVKMSTRQSALDIQAKRARNGFKRTRSVGLSQADTQRLERMKKDPKIKMKRSKSSGVVAPPRKKNADPWSHCKGLYSRKKSLAAKKKWAMRAAQKNTCSDVESACESPLRLKDSKGKYISKTHVAASSSSEDTGMSADDIPVNTAVKKKGLLRSLLASGKESDSICDKSEGNSCDLVSQSAEMTLKWQSSEQIPKASKKTRRKKSLQSSVARGQMTITSWLTGMNGHKGEQLQTLLGTEKGNMENDINFLNQTEAENINDEKSLIIKYKGKKFVVKKENDSKSENAESEDNWPKSDMVLRSVLNSECIGSSPARITRQSLSEKADSVIDTVLQSSLPIDSGPALGTRQAISDKKHGSVEHKQKRIYTPKTFPRGKSKKVDICDTSNLSDSFVYGTPRRSVRCSLNTKFQDNFSSMSDSDEKCEPYYSPSPSSSSHISSSSSDLKLLYFDSGDDDEEEDKAEDTSTKCGPEGDNYQCLIVDMEEEKESQHSSIITLSDDSTEEMSEVVEANSTSTSTDDPNTSTYVIQSYSGNHGFQQLSISIPSV